jgi:hypothetical protein
MNQLEIQPYRAEHASIEVLDAPDGVLVKLTGTLDQWGASDCLAPLLAQVHEGALARRLPRVSVDLSGMDFLNSTGIKTLATWLMKRGSLATGETYAVKVIYAGDVTWQVATLRAIEAVARGALETERR